MEREKRQNDSEAVYGIGFNTQDYDPGDEVLGDSDRNEPGFDLLGTIFDENDGLEEDKGGGGSKNISYGNFDEVNYYLRAASETPLLEAEEEIELAKRIKLGDYAGKRLKDEALTYLSQETRGKFENARDQGREARDHMIRANLRLVVSIAKKYRGGGIEFLDLIQEGNEGLMKAVDKFDHTKGNKFSTYGTWWIRQAITRAILTQGRSIRLPVHVGERLRRIKKAASELEQVNGSYPTIEEIADYLHLSPYSVEETIEAGKDPLSLEEPFGEEADAELMDFVIDPDEDEEGGVFDNIRDETVREVLETARLTNREREILKWRFGLTDGEPKTLEEIAGKYHVTRERIRQLEAFALRKLRHPSSGLRRAL